MSTETQTETVDRSIAERLRASPFLSQLLSNRLAITGIVIIVAVVLIAVYARFTYNLSELMATQFGTNPAESPPSSEYLFGTDGQARDIFPRVMYGAWYAVLYGTVTVIASTFLGVSLGIVAAYYGDLTDNVIMRTMDVLLSFPSLLLALALVTIFPEELGLWRAVGALTLVYTPRFARVVRGAALKVLEDEYTDATKALGATDPRLLVRHVLPNCLAPITVQSTLNYGLAIIDIAALSFLGFGASPGEPTWGMMLSNGVEFGLFSGAWWWSFFPGLLLALTVLGFNLLGDGMRDALDPRMRETVD
ncbi:MULTISPECIES: ABC transporter permease [Halorubrum]|jgi:peptide/nickel transport system permease protein|uniref:Peptide ABC transporter permease n=1 Tax=Halorubrum tropicale TaxID=1765655 RepID=A0A0N0UAA2_9EURY|nr:MULTISPECIES: ABC transporter permease [Halorubrum]KOX95864.1 peptide ABC transporter permease [Halorubrum tropicale]MDV7349696.1 ABC transporter permease [Halorubrum distributum]OYR86492.1 ABC transporter permease [Halorubrum distributum]TKX44603.1 ABC transporter permease [Halorubrum sp. ARQ200]TKX49055.1 ABC transporter permease [Halorubrum sp. ASP121]